MTETIGDSSRGDARAHRRRVWVTIVGTLLAVSVAAFVFNGRFDRDPHLVASPLVGQPVPDLSLPYLEEEGSLSLSALRGQIVVLNVWASWCFPCRAEHAALTTAAAAYEGRGVHFVGLLYQDQVDQAMAFLDDFSRGANYSYVTDEGSRAAVELGVYGVPETYFVDAAGIIRGRVQGEVDTALLVATINDLLAGRDPAS